MLEVNEKAGHGALAMEYEHSLMSLARSFARLPSPRFDSLPFPLARHVRVGSHTSAAKAANRGGVRLRFVETILHS